MDLIKRFNVVVGPGCRTVVEISEWWKLKKLWRRWFSSHVCCSLAIEAVSQINSHQVFFLRNSDLCVIRQSLTLTHLYSSLLLCLHENSYTSSPFLLYYLHFEIAFYICICIYLGIKYIHTYISLPKSSNTSIKKFSHIPVILVLDSFFSFFFF